MASPREVAACCWASWRWSHPSRRWALWRMRRRYSWPSWMAVRAAIVVTPHTPRWRSREGEAAIHRWWGSRWVLGGRLSCTTCLMTWAIGQLHGSPFLARNGDHAAVRLVLCRGSRPRWRAHQQGGPSRKRSEGGGWPECLHQLHLKGARATWSPSAGAFFDGESLHSKPAPAVP